MITWEWAVQPGMLSASQLTWKLIFINYCLKLLCWAVKLARFTNNYVVLMMFSTPFRSHQQSAMFGCCAGFVWKWHPAFSKLWPGGSSSRGPVNTNFHQTRFLSEMCFCLSPVVATRGRSPHLILVSELNVVNWDNLYGLQELWWLQTIHEDPREKVSALQQRWRSSRSKTALRRGSWGKLDAQSPRFWPALEVSGLGQREGRGEMIL